jgi:hypothetical protein
VIPAGSRFTGMSAEQIWKQVDTTASRATSAHVIGQLDYKGQPVRVDLKLTLGTKAIGQVTLDGHPVSMRRVGKVIYFRADRSYWLKYGNAQAAKLFAGRWIKVSQGPEDFQDLFELTQLRFFTDELDPTNPKALTLVPGITINGLPTVGLSDMTKGGKPGQDSGLMYVAAKGPSLPLSLKLDDDQYSFSDWNQSVDVVAPSGKDVVDLDRLLAATKR